MERDWLVCPAMVLTWPVVYFFWLFLYSLLAAPLFPAPEKRKKTPGLGLGYLILF